MHIPEDQCGAYVAMSPGKVTKLEIMRQPEVGTLKVERPTEVYATLADLYTTRLGIFCLMHLLSSLAFHPSTSSPLDAQKSIHY